MSTMNWPYPGLGHAPSYQVSGIPYVTGGLTVSNTPIQISFPYVTNWIYITQDSAQDLRVGFSSNGVSAIDFKNYFVLHGSTDKSVSFPLHVKCSSIFLLRDGGSDVTGVSILAGLTSIPISELNSSGPKGANWSGSLGVG